MGDLTNLPGEGPVYRCPSCAGWLVRVGSQPYRCCKDRCEYNTKPSNKQGPYR